MVLLFTFGSGTLGELGTGRLDDTKRSKAIAVNFPVSAPRNADGEPALEAVALGTDHSLALVGNHVYRWGLLGASLDHQRRGESCQPEVVPEPVSISELVLFAGKNNGQNINGNLSSPDGFVRSITCGGSNSFMVNYQGELFMLGSLKSRANNPDSLRHIWGNPRGDASCRVARVSAGWRHCLILTEAGTVFALGDDEHGQCAGVGTGTMAVSLPKGQTPEAIVGISAGACHSLAWDNNGAAYSWGHGGSGRLGVGGTRNRRAPTRVEMIQDRVAFARCGANFTVFATSYGRSLWACGGNQYGQLGVGGESRNACEVPVPLGFPQNGQEVVSLECGANHVLCLTRYEDTYERLIAWAWGCASSGQCGRICEEETNKSFPASRSIPGALADFLPPTQNWPLAISAGRSHSAVLAQVGRPTDEEAFNSVNLSKFEIDPNLTELVPNGRNCRRLPEAPKEIDTMAYATGPKIANAPNQQWAFPEGGSISHIHRMNGGETTMSPLRAASQSPRMETQLDPNTTAQDDIIDLFCAGLSIPNRSPNRLPSPPQQRAVSPVVGDLIKFGEAALHNGDATQMSSIMAQDQPSLLEDGNRSKIQPATFSGVRRNIVTGARKPSTKVARSSTPQRGVNTSWPQPPSSWSATSRRRASSQNRSQHQRRRGSQSPSLERIHQHPATPPPSQPTSMWEAHPGPYVVGISTLSTTMDVGSPHCVEGSPKLPPAPAHIHQAVGMQVPLANPFAAREYGTTVSQPLPNVNQNDEWTGVHASIQGLTTMIASIGRLGTSASPPQSFHTMARDIAAGGTGNAFHYGHASPDMNANISGYHHGANGTSPPRQRRSQGVLLPSSPPSVPHRIVAEAATLSHNSSPAGHWTSPQRLEQSPRRLSSIHTSPVVQKWEHGAPREECGSDSDTHLDFSPRSTGSSPPQRGPARRRLSNTPTRKTPVAVAPTHVPASVVTNPFIMESATERSMFVLNGTGQVPLSPCSEEPPSADSIGRPLDQSGITHGGENNDRFIEDVHVVPEPAESTRWPALNLPEERESSPRKSHEGFAPLVLEASGPTSDAMEPYSKRSSSAGGLEIPPPLSLSRRSSADSADTADSALKNSTIRRDSNSKAVARSKASSVASVPEPNTVTFPLVDGLSLGTAQDRESRDSIEELQTPAFGKRMSAGTTEKSSSSEEDDSDGGTSSSAGSRQPSPKAVAVTGRLAKGIESDDGSDSESASDDNSNGDSSSSSSDDGADSSQANKGLATTTSDDWV